MVFQRNTVTNRYKNIHLQRKICGASWPVEWQGPKSMKCKALSTTAPDEHSIPTGQTESEITSPSPAAGEIGRRWRQWIGQTLEKNSVKHNQTHFDVGPSREEEKRSAKGHIVISRQTPRGQLASHTVSSIWCLWAPVLIPAPSKNIKNPLTGHKVEHCDMFYHSHKHTQWSYFWLNPAFTTRLKILPNKCIIFCSSGVCWNLQ